MNILIKITEKTPETLNEPLFTQHMKNVPVQDYTNNSKWNFLSLCYDDIEKIIKQYY